MRRMRSQSTPIVHEANLKEKAHRPFTPQPSAVHHSLFELAQVIYYYLILDIVFKDLKSTYLLWFGSATLSSKYLQPH